MNFFSEEVIKRPTLFQNLLKANSIILQRPVIRHNLEFSPLIQSTVQNSDSCFFSRNVKVGRLHNERCVIISQHFAIQTLEILKNVTNMHKLYDALILCNKSSANTFVFVQRMTHSIHSSSCLSLFSHIDIRILKQIDN